ncbi:hypothetical protein D7X33_10735 [Butyricicoccus sp. 1XD8-22]|nr:hypothetical protein D7X33_10735 [Butyricicoccus sp. 1XD8-22]
MLYLGNARGSAPGPRAFAASAGALPLDPGPARAAPEGLAPLDSLSRLRAGRGILGFGYGRVLSDQPAIRTAGWSGYVGAGKSKPFPSSRQAFPVFPLPGQQTKTPAIWRG